MTATYVGVGAQAGTATTNATVTYAWPSGYTPTAGDLAIVCQGGWWTQPSSSSPPNGPQPTGYTFRAKSSRDASTTLCVASSTYYKFLDGTESAPSVTATSTYAGTNQSIYGFVIIFRYIHNTTIFDGSAVASTSGAATFLTTTSQNTSVNDVIAFHFANQGAGNGALTSSGGNTWTARASGASYDTANASQGMATKYTATAGAIGFMQWTSVATGGWAALVDRLVGASVSGAPTGLSVTKAIANSVSLSWTAPTDNGGQNITDYTIEYSTNNSTWTTFSDGISTSTTATITGLTVGTLYYFRVSAVNSVGTGTASSTINARTTGFCMPGILNRMKNP